MYSVADFLLILHGNAGWWDEGAYVIAALAGALAVATFAFSMIQSRRAARADEQSGTD